MLQYTHGGAAPRIGAALCFEGRLLAEDRQRYLKRLGHIHDHSIHAGRLADGKDLVHASQRHVQL